MLIAQMTIIFKDEAEARAEHLKLIEQGYVLMNYREKYNYLTGTVDVVCDYDNKSYNRTQYHAPL